MADAERAPERLQPITVYLNAGQREALARLARRLEQDRGALARRFVREGLERAGALPEVA